MSSKQIIGICKYCREEKELCVSHSIPDAFGKRIRRLNNGKALVISAENVTPINSSDGGGCRMLCSCCEDIFNRKYDRFLVHHTRLIRNRFENGEELIFSIDAERLIRSLMSVLWRASHSSEECFAHLPQPKPTDELRHLLRSQNAKFTDLFATSVSIISSISKKAVNESELTTMRDIILPPFLSKKSHFHVEEKELLTRPSLC